MLERGGNAFDAAVAAGFVLQVVEPHLNGPGGDLPVVAWSAARGEPFVVCGQGVAPAAGRASALLRDELGLDVVPGTGLLAACVPGSFDAWLLMLLEHGTLRLGEVLEYAIGYAETGFPALGRIVETIAGVEELFREEWTTSAELWLPAPEAGSWMRNQPLARTYRRIVAEAEAADRRPRRADRARARAPGARAGWPRRSCRSAHSRRCSTRRAAATAGCSPRPTWRAGARRSRRRRPTTTAA